MIALSRVKLIPSYTCKAFYYEKYLIHEEFMLRLSIKKNTLRVKVAEQKVDQLQLDLFNVEESFITQQEDYAQMRHQRKLVRRAQRHGMTLIQISITIHIYLESYLSFPLLFAERRMQQLAQHQQQQQPQQHHDDMVPDSTT